MIEEGFLVTNWLVKLATNYKYFAAFADWFVELWLFSKKNIKWLLSHIF